MGGGIKTNQVAMRPLSFVLFIYDLTTNNKRNCSPYQ